MSGSLRQADSSQVKQGLLSCVTLYEIRHRQTACCMRPPIGRSTSTASPGDCATSSETTSSRRGSRNRNKSSSRPRSQWLWIGRVPRTDTRTLVVSLGCKQRTLASVNKHSRAEPRPASSKTKQPLKSPNQRPETRDQRPSHLPACLTPSTWSTHHTVDRPTG